MAMETNSSSIGCMASASCFPMCQSPNGGFRLLGREIEFHEAPRQSYNAWRHLIRTLIREGKKIYVSPKPLDFRYDEASYAKNFDEGLEG